MRIHTHACTCMHAAIYGVADKIDFICGDFLELASGFCGKVDAVFLSPPWGGPDYSAACVFDISQMTVDGERLFRAARSITDAIAMFLPRNVNVAQLVALACLPGPVSRKNQDDTCSDSDGPGPACARGRAVEVEKNLVNSRLKAVTVYYGSLVRPL